MSISPKNISLADFTQLRALTDGAPRLASMNQMNKTGSVSAILEDKGR